MRLIRREIIMNSQSKFFAATLIIVFIVANGLFAQGRINTPDLGIGINAGLQHLYGDKLPAGVGLASELSLRYFITDNFNTNFNVGYGQLNDGFTDKSFSTDVINFDVKANFNLFRSRLRPYVSAGVGGVNSTYNREKAYISQFDDSTTVGESITSLAMIVGGGFDFIVSPKVALNAFVDYRHTLSDELDGGYNSQFSQTNDGYLNGRVGLTYFLGRATQEDQEGVPGLEEMQLEAEEDTGMIAWEEALQEAAETDEAGGEYPDLQSRVQELNQKLQQRDQDIENLESQLTTQEQRIQELESELEEVEGQMGTAPIAGTGGTYKQNYERALQLFYSRQYSQSLQLFRTLRDQYPNHKLASNCQYWMGENYFGMAQYSQATQAFLSVFSYDFSYKFDDATIMLGRCYEKMGDYENARKYFQQLLNDYPDSEYVGVAQKWLNRL